MPRLCPSSGPVSGFLSRPLFGTSLLDTNPCLASSFHHGFRAATFGPITRVSPAKAPPGLLHFFESHSRLVRGISRRRSLARHPRITQVLSTLSQGVENADVLQLSTTIISRVAVVPAGDTKACRLRIDMSRELSDIQHHPARSLQPAYRTFLDTWECRATSCRSILKPHAWGRCSAESVRHQRFSHRDTSAAVSIDSARLRTVMVHLMYMARAPRHGTGSISSW
ncbi:hypothetical protein VUR80DRAFT_4505 [Thermomyces stellatus]